MRARGGHRDLLGQAATGPKPGWALKPGLWFPCKRSIGLSRGYTDAVTHIVRAMSVASFVLRSGLAVLSAGAVAFHAPQAQALCVSSSAAGNCDTFDPTSSSAITYFGFTDGTFTSKASIASIQFLSDSLTSPNNLTFNSLEYSFDSGINWLNANLTTSGSVPPNTLGANLLSSPVTKPGGGNIGSGFQLRFLLPSQTILPLNNPTSVIGFSVTTNGTVTAVTQTRFSSPVSAAAVPGPLPILGAGVAFSLSRTLRKRIKATTEA